MTIRDYLEPIDELVDLGIDTISYAVGDCSVLLYATEVGERWGHNVDLTDHDVWYRAAQNAAAMIESGNDPLRLVCDRAHEKGFQFLPHMLLNMMHTDHGRVTACRVADFTTEHPEWQVGPEPDYPVAAFDRPDRLSYAHPEVRANRLAVIEELVSRYPTDGIEVNFADYTPLIARREVPEHTETITGWVREIRGVCDRAAAEQGRTKRLVVRVPATLAVSKSHGMDVETWVREEIVDAAIAIPVRGGWANDTRDLREMVELAEGTGVKILAGQDTAGEENSRSVNHAAVANCYAAGAKGVLFHTYYPDPNRHPYDDEATGRIRFTGHPELLALKDKTFWLGPPPERSEAGKFGLKDQLPLELEPGAPGPELTLEVSDDVAAKAGLGELWRCELRVLLNHRTHSDSIRVLWNGVEVPESAQRWADWTYQLRPRPSSVRGYRLHVDLKQDLLPKAGGNVLRVEALTKDQTLINSITVAEVEVVVEYLPHRNALRPEEAFRAG